MIAEHIAALLLGFVVDLILGDPPFLWHPVRGIGRLISGTEAFLRPRLARRTIGKSAKACQARDEQLAGLLLAGVVCSVTVMLTAAVLFLSGLIHPLLRFGVQVVMSWQILALRSLCTESMKVYDKLMEGELGAARAAVAMIVGRDTDHLDEAQIARAAVETVAENTSDGVVAPFLFLLLGGPAAGFLYKAINTMDSMIGYRNERYLNFGKAAARLDDAANFIPARLSAWLMIAAAWILEKLSGKGRGQVRYHAAGAVRIYLRDRFNHQSPNSAQTEAVCAGALGLKLAGDAVYGGVTVKKPSIGDDLRPITALDICRANRLLFGTAGLLAGLTAAGYIWLNMLF